MTTSEPQFICRFAAQGFPFSVPNSLATPCFTRYHLPCVTVGLPFKTRLKDDAGLSMPPLTDYPGFICELCTTRSVLDRELSRGPSDLALLMLERMRLIDSINSLSRGTHKSYQSKMRVIRAFEGTFGVPVLRLSPVSQPPTSSAIPLMWAQQRYALQPARWSRKPSAHNQDIRSTVTYGTVRGLRSAASMFYRLDMQTAFPGSVFLDQAQRALSVNHVSPTDELAYTLMNSGMARRMGEEVRPSIALLGCHVRYLDASLAERLHGPISLDQKLEVCRAAFANLNLWCGWLRATENFSLCFCDVACTPPAHGALWDLPPGVGCLQERLLEQTKSSPTRTADLILAYCTGSGLAPGYWFERLLELEGLHPDAAASCELDIFRHSSGARWTSHYFRTTFLWPSLHEQRLRGDAALRPFDGSPGNSIEDKYWSLHSYRRGARSHVSKRRANCVRKATPTEVSEHGRWRTKRSSMDMPTAYLEWTISDRVNITLLCM